MGRDSCRKAGPDRHWLGYAPAPGKGNRPILEQGAKNGQRKLRARRRWIAERIVKIAPGAARRTGPLGTRRIRPPARARSVAREMIRCSSGGRRSQADWGGGGPAQCHKFGLGRGRLGMQTSGGSHLRKQLDSGGPARFPHANSSAGTQVPTTTGKMKRGLRRVPPSSFTQASPRPPAVVTAAITGSRLSTAPARAAADESGFPEAEGFGGLLPARANPFAYSGCHG